MSIILRVQFISNLYTLVILASCLLSFVMLAMIASGPEVCMDREQY